MQVFECGKKSTVLEIPIFRAYLMPISAFFIQITPDCKYIQTIELIPKTERLKRFHSKSTSGNKTFPNKTCLKTKAPRKTSKRSRYSNLGGRTGSLWIHSCIYGWRARVFWWKWCRNSNFGWSLEITLMLIFLKMEAIDGNWRRKLWNENCGTKCVQRHQMGQSKVS